MRKVTPILVCHLNTNSNDTLCSNLKPIANMSFRSYPKAQLLRNLERAARLSFRPIAPTAFSGEISNVQYIFVLSQIYVSRLLGGSALRVGSKWQPKPICHFDPSSKLSFWEISNVQPACHFDPLLQRLTLEKSQTCSSPVISTHCSNGILWRNLYRAVYFCTITNLCLRLLGGSALRVGSKWQPKLICHFDHSSTPSFWEILNVQLACHFDPLLQRLTLEKSLMCSIFLYYHKPTFQDFSMAALCG